MQALFDFFAKVFSLGTVDSNPNFYNELASVFTGAVLVAAILIVVLVVLIITIAVLAVKNNHKKSKLKDAAHVLEDNGETRNRIRGELEPIIRKEIELEYKDKLPKSGVTDEQYERLKKKLDEKDAQIKELGRALDSANAATHAISANSGTAEISKTVADLTLQNSLLTDQNNQYHNEINELQEEIQKLKEQKGRQQAAAARSKQKAVDKVKADAAKEKAVMLEKQKAEKAAAEKAAKEKEAAVKAAEKAAKEAAKEAERKAKEAAAKAAKEAAEKAAKEIAEKAAKEAAAKAAKEAAEKASKEAAAKAAKEAAEKASKEAAAKAAKEAVATQKAEAAANADDDEYDNEFGDENSAIKVTLKFDEEKGDWVIDRSDSNRAYRRLATKQEALPIARDLAKRLQAQLIVHNKDGKLSYNL